MLFGGWNRNMADFVTMYDLTSLKDRLVSWGFSENNIRTFFANGIKANLDDGKSMYIQVVSNTKKIITHYIYPSVLDGNEYSSSMSNVEPATKLNIRRYIKGICGTERCADTLFFYLSNPTRKDGNTLLWDANSNGIVSIHRSY